MNIRQFKEHANELQDQIVSWRRDFHKHPELGFKEIRTSGIIAQTLREIGLEVHTGMAETGVVAELVGKASGPTVLLRFDMDALPIQELNRVDYASVHAGVMHACGHDGHMAIGLAIASMLVRFREAMRGSVKFVFQPAEEILGGAERMINEGLLKKPVPDFCLALHLWNEKPEGWVGISAGPLMAGAERFEITLTGKGGHGAAPDQTLDPIYTSAQLITALQSIVSRNLDPKESAVISIGQLEAGDTYNVIPEKAVLRGTVRTFEPHVRNLVLERLESVSISIASTFGCTADVKIVSVSPPVVNEPRVTKIAQDATNELFPELDLDEDVMTMVSEDMALIMQAIPGCYILIGSQDAERGLDAPHHNPYFDFNEAVLPKAAAILAASTWRILERS
jgi:amidohydrolase